MNRQKDPKKNRIKENNKTSVGGGGGTWSDFWMKLLLAVLGAVVQFNDDGDGIFFIVSFWFNCLVLMFVAFKTTLSECRWLCSMLLDLESSWLLWKFTFSVVERHFCWLFLLWLVVFCLGLTSFYGYRLCFKDFWLTLPGFYCLSIGYYKVFFTCWFCLVPCLGSSSFCELVFTGFYGVSTGFYRFFFHWCSSFMEHRFLPVQSLFTELKQLSVGFTGFNWVLIVFYVSFWWF